MQTAICCIAKCENNYLREWVDYHLALGFSRIFIYDNNDVDGERIEPLFEDNKQVTILDCRGEKAYQNKAYTQFYKMYGNDFDWIAFIDVDEFITFSEKSGLKNIEDFLGRFDEKAQVIHLNWMCFGDNGIVDLGDYNVLGRFTIPLDFDKKVKYDFPENNHVKSIFRGKLRSDNIIIGAHTFDVGEFQVVDSRGNVCDNSFFLPYDFSIAYVRHYVTKTIIEWILKKSRGRVSTITSSDYYSFDRFFLYNGRTKEKECFIAYYSLLKESFMMANSTDLTLLNSKLEYIERQFEIVNGQYQRVIHSKAYKIGKFLMKPFSLLREVK